MPSPFHSGTSAPSRAQRVAVREPEDHPHIEQVLAHVGKLAREAGVDATTELVVGSPPFELLLAAAKRTGADLIVMGRSDTRRPGMRHVGGQTEHVLEFSEVPVLVVPGPVPPADRHQDQS